MARPGWTPGIVRARRVEAHFARQLRKIAYQVADLVKAFPAGDLTYWPELEASLARYGEAIGPWARSAANAMIAEVNRRDLASWAELSATMKRSLKDEIINAPTGAVMRRLLDEQVVLITSLPIEAGERVHRWTLEGIANGSRAAEVSAAIQATSEVTAARANTIARTETSRTAMTLTQARAEHVGSRSYIWRTSGDTDVRPSHKALNGRVCDWATPPLCDPPDYHAHPGCIWNCRCYAEPIIPE